MFLHKVQQSECLLSIAEHYGFFWQTLWQHPENSQLRKLRKDPNTLYPGDILMIPGKQVKEVPCSTEARHRFVKKGNLAKVKIRLLIDDQPRANVPYLLCVDGRWFDGQTDDEGFVKLNIPAVAVEGLLVVGPPDDQQILPLKFGALDPIGEDSGVMQRLTQLGFNTAIGLEATIRSFQEKNNLLVTGRMDEPTRACLKDAYGQ
jgi:hypothetical protein